MQGQSPLVECTACGEQQRKQDTDAGHCKHCGGECMELDAIYGPNGSHPDPDWQMSQ